MREKVETGFLVCKTKDCSETFRTDIRIIDPHNGSRCTICQGAEIENFLVKNPKKKEIHFLAIDGCVFSSSDPHKKCDCAVFDDHSFWFIEIKDTPALNKKTKRNHLSKAYKQLDTTMKLFTQKIDLQNHDLLAIVAFKYKPVRPVSSATSQSKRLEFLRKHRARLMLGNEGTF